VAELCLCAGSHRSVRWFSHPSVLFLRRRVRRAWCAARRPAR